MKKFRLLKGKTVLVTGAAGGIGSALARHLYRKEGCFLLLVDKDTEGLRQLKKTLLQDEVRSDSIKTYPTDLSSPDNIRDLLNVIRGKVDVLINNAGVSYSGSFEMMSLDNFWHITDVNLHAAVRLTHGLLPTLTKKRGAIVMIASAAGLLAAGGMCAYSVSKFGMVAFAESLRAELAGIVGVTTICPSFVSTGIAKKSLLSKKLSAEEQRAHHEKLDSYLKQRGINPDKVARTTIRAIKKNRGLVTIFSLDIYFLWLLKRILPGLTDLINRLMYQKIVREGLIRK